jgi:hypothetical protein
MRAALLLAALAVSASAAPEPRTVLALYLPGQIPGKHKDTAYLPLHQQAELPLNQAGLVVEWLDVSKPLPDPASRPDVRGTLAWFAAERSFDDSRPLCKWLDEGAKRGWKTVFLGAIGLYKKDSVKDTLPTECKELFKTLGFELGGTHAVEPLDVAVATASAMIGFERRPDLSEKGFVPMSRMLPGVSGSAELKLKAVSDDLPWKELHPIAVTARGALGLDPFFFYQNNEMEPAQFRWIVDPFSFFAKAFGTEGLPRPDASTLSGRRLFFTHVDGDGFFNASEVDRTRLSGEVFLRELVEKMTDMPFTLSLIAGYYDLALYNDAASIDLSRRALRRPNVEPAAHAYSHPLVWAERTIALKIPRYALDLRKEVQGSMKMIGDLILNGRQPKLFLWSGDCVPNEETVGYAESAGFLHMNGGGGRFDRRTPSYAYLFPLSRMAGRHRQLYAPHSNENVFTNLWTGPYYGYREVVETFERTETPLRVKPVDVYIHFYSAERYASLQALKGAYDWARRQPLVPVFAGRYAKAANGFFEMKVERLGPRRFRLDGGAALRTVRFDGEKGVPDLRASKGVLGWTRKGQALYVALDESASREVALGPEQESGPRLEEASFEVLDWKTAGGGVSFRKQGWWVSECTLAGLAPGRAYAVNGGGLQAVLQAGPDGRLKLRFPDSERGRPSSAVEVRPS